RVRAAPRHVRGRSVDWWNRPIEQAQIDGQLRAVMRGVQDPTPEDPHASTLYVEEGDAALPPVGRCVRQMRQPCLREIDETLDARVDAEAIGDDGGGVGFGQAEEAAEKPSARE